VTVRRVSHSSLPIRYHREPCITSIHVEIRRNSYWINFSRRVTYEMPADVRSSLGQLLAEARKAATAGDAETATPLLASAHTVATNKLPMATCGIAFNMAVRLLNRHFRTVSWQPPTSRRWNNGCPRSNSGMLPP